MDDSKAQLLWIGLSETKVTDTLKNESLTKLLLELIEILRKYNNSTVLDRNIGKLVYQAATTSKVQIRQHLPLVIEYISNQKIDSEIKLTAAINYLLANPTSVDVEKFEQNSGVGVQINNEQIFAEVATQISKYRKELIEKRYRFNIGILIVDVKKILPFADGKAIKAEVDSQILALLGPKNENDTIKPKKELKEANKDGNKKPAAKEEECKDIIELLKRVNFHKVGENFKTDGYVITSNTMNLLTEHVKNIKGQVRTRFPPEPNGILHIGHAKAININFGYAQANGGICFLRYDDTNPEKEEERFVLAIRDMVEWLGYKPFKITYSSDYFDQLYELAVKLIKIDLAYVCHQKPEELKGFNPPQSPWRNRSIQENLLMFDAMKLGKLAEGEATLRMKITLEEGKVDPVAYRIKMAAHHRTGNRWCIYPTYDFTHCLVDSMENITHSLCTKEFQSRRSAYYWLCNSLDKYCPVQWEYSRLNVNYTVVSKRKIAKLIQERIVDDWDDPRLFTLTALRRRGFPPQAINSFCAQMGLTVASASVDPIMLEASVRDVLNTTAPRAMAVLSPIRLVISNMSQIVPIYIEIPDFPSDPNSAKHMIPLEKELFIESDDFREDISDPTYRRLTLKQMVGLRHTGCAIELKTIHRKPSGEIDYLEVIQHPVDSLKEKPKAFIHWVSVPLIVEVRLYEPLFYHKNPEDTNEVPNGFLSDCNLNSKIVKKVLVDISVKYAQPYQQFQFERVGFFSVDPDSRIGKLVFNRTVLLKDSQSKN